MLALVHTSHHPSGGTDYRSARIPVTFSAGRKERTFTVIINDDVDLEFDEYFFVDLEIPAAAAEYGVRKGSPNTTTVHIEDDGETCYKICTVLLHVPEMCILCFCLWSSYIFCMYELIHTIMYMLYAENVLSGHYWLKIVNCSPYSLLQ